MTVYILLVAKRQLLLQFSLIKDDLQLGSCIHAKAMSDEATRAALAQILQNLLTQHQTHPLLLSTLHSPSTSSSTSSTTSVRLRNAISYLQMQQHILERSLKRIEEAAR